MTASTTATLAQPAALVVSMCRAGGVGTPSDDQLAPLADAQFLHDFEHYARRERVFGLILEALTPTSQFAELPDSVQSHLLQSLRHLRHQGVFWDLQCEQVVTVLAAAECKPLLLKGGALRRTVYASPAARPVADLDVLLPKERVDAAITRLEQLGYSIEPSPDMRAAYEAHHFHIVLRNAQGFIVEVHWGLTTPHSAFRLDPDAFFDGAVLLDGAADLPVRVPRPEHAFLHTVGQLAIEYPFIGRLVDLDRLVRAYPRFDWNYLAQAAEHSRLGNALLLWTTVLHRMLGTPIPGLRELGAEGMSPLVRFHLALLDVPSFMTLRTRRSSEAMVALRLWQGPNGGSRFQEFVKLFGRWGRIDEEAVVLMHGNGVMMRPGHVLHRHYKGVKDVLRLVGYQAWLYGLGVVAAFSPRGRSRFSLYSDLIEPARAHP